MRAAVAESYGGPEVVRIAEVPTPDPGPKQVLVRVRAAALTAADNRIRAARFPRGFGLIARLGLGIRKPRKPILGSSLAGVVEGVGSEVTDFALGDEVCGMTGAAMGAHAEYAVVPAKKLAILPPGVSHEDAAAVLFGGTTALQFLRDKAQVRAGQSVLVNGASGAVGTSVVQIARHAGATVTALTSAPNAELVTRLGAAKVVDYTTTPVAGLSERFDIVLDAVGNIDITTGRSLLAPDGVLLLVTGDLPTSLRARGNVKAGVAAERPEDFRELLDLLAAGTLDPVISRTSALDDIAELHSLIDSGRKVGNVVVVP